jgi:hypothetical protein
MAKIKFRRDTAAAWTGENPTLAQGEPGFEHDTGLFKIGDGATAWTSLDYSGSGDSINNGSYSVSVGSDGVVTMSTSRGTVEFGALPEPGETTHFHIMKGPGQNGNDGMDLYFGDDFNYVLQRADSYGGSPAYGVEIGAQDLGGDGSQHVWRFNTDGDLYIPPGSTIRDSLTGNDLLDGASGGNGSLTSASSIEVETGDSDRWLVRLRREGSKQDPSGSEGVTVYSTNYDSEGNAIVVAFINLSDGNDSSGDGLVVAKFKSSGVLVWKKSIGAVDDNYYLESNAVIDSDDNIILAVNPDNSQLKIIVKINGDTGAVIFSEELALTNTLKIRAIAVDSGNNIIIGGGMAFTFIKAQRGKVGNSLVEDDKLALALELMEMARNKNVNLYLPTDAIIADAFAADANCKECSIASIPSGWMGLDIGVKSREHFAAIIAQSKTVLWNGPMGVFEMEAFAAGTVAVANALVEATKNGSFTLVGGGDSVAAINQFGLANDVSYVSTGGGAMLESLEGIELPGVAAITV